MSGPSLTDEELYPPYHRVPARLPMWGRAFFVFVGILISHTYCACCAGVRRYGNHRGMERDREEGVNEKAYRFLLKDTSSADEEALSSGLNSPVGGGSVARRHTGRHPKEPKKAAPAERPERLD